MRIRFLLILVLVLQNSVAMPATHGATDPLLDSHCTDAHEQQHGGEPSCAMDCQCPPGGGTTAVEVWMHLSTARVQNALAVDAQPSARRINYDPPYRPPRHS